MAARFVLRALYLPTIVAAHAALLHPTSGASIIQRFDLGRREPHRIHTPAELTEVGLVEGTPRAPWPDAQVRYCFKDESSSKNLVHYLTKALAQWQPAHPYTPLRVVPDVACHKTKDDYDYACICGTQANARATADDTLVIDDGREGSDPASWKPMITCYVGYNSRIKTPARHSLHFGAINDKQDERFTKEQVESMRVTLIAHELGHAIGLLHEHQRPDAAKYIVFRPKYLEGYDEALAKMDSDQYRRYFADKPTWDAKLEVLQENSELRKEVWPIYKDYQPVENWKLYAYDKSGFDYNSVMIYSTCQSHLEGSNTLAGQCPLAKKLPNTGKIWGPKDEAIWMGGHEFNGRISAADIRKVAELYPGTPQQQKDAESLEQWQPTKASVPGYVDEIDLHPNPVDVRGPNLKPLPRGGAVQKSDDKPQYGKDSKAGKLKGWVGKKLGGSKSGGSGSGKSPFGG